MSAITDAEYKRFTEKQWIGTRVRSLVPIKTRYSEMPAGTTWTVKNKFSGFSLQGDPCSCCGIKVSVDKVPVQWLERAAHG